MKVNTTPQSLALQLREIKQKIHDIRACANDLGAAAEVECMNLLRRIENLAADLLGN